MKLHLATLALSLLLQNILPVAHAQETCSGVELAFTLIDLTGTCTYETLLAEYTTQVFDKTGNTCRPPDLTAKEDFDAKLMLATGEETGELGGAKVCKDMYDGAEQTPFNYAAAKGSTTDASDLHFEQMFYDGLGEWQDEVETTYEDPDGDATSVLRRDAAKVREFYEGLGSYSRVEWPDSLTQFEASTCNMNAAMCCWPKDRQANDGNGNCAKPYDENCVDKDPADNTNLCFSDLQAGDRTSNLNSSSGFMVFPEDNNNGEGAIHCHGFAWADDEYDTISRYRANNLFFVSMYDHMHQRGYVKNIPGMPMCGCMDQMPLATRSDCTQVDLTEDWIVEYDGTNFVGTLTKVEIDFNACRGRNNRNNDLWAYAARLYDEGRMSAANFGNVGRKLTNDHDCHHATEYHKALKGYTTGYNHDETRETQVAGRDALYMTPFGREAFNKALFEQSETAPDRDVEGTVTVLGEAYGSPVVHRVCPHCVDSHKHVYYRRLTAIPEGFDLLHHMLYYRSSAGKEGNIWNVDFTLHSTYQDAVEGLEPWTCPNDAFNYWVPFYGNCHPAGGRKVDNQYSVWSWFPGPQEDMAYYVNKPDNSGLQDYTSNSQITRAATLVDVDIGNPGMEGNTWEDNGTYHITGSGNDIWWYRDQFHYKAQQSEGDVDVSVHLTSFANNGGDGNAKAGIMLRATLDDDSTYAFGMLSWKYGIRLQRRLSKAAHANNSPGNGFTADPPQNAQWLRLVKKMETVEFYYKVDEADEWILLQTDTILFPDDKFYVGLAVCSHRNDYLAEATFEDYAIDTYEFPTSAPSISSAPTPWTPLVQVGESNRKVPSFSQSADLTVDYIKGTSKGIWGTEDLGFTYYNFQRANTPSMTVEVYIQRFDTGYRTARGGLMIRDTNDVDSPYVFLGAAGADQGAVFQSRASAGAHTEHHKMHYVNNINSMWVKLVRDGNLYTAYYKEGDGDEYEQLGATIEVVMPGSTIQVGRAVTPGDAHDHAEVWMETKNYSVVSA